MPSTEFGSWQDPAKRETAMATNDEDPLMHIYTSQRRVINRLKKDGRFTLVEEGRDKGILFAYFTIPAEMFTGTGFRRKVSDPALQASLRLRMEKARLARSRRAREDDPDFDWQAHHDKISGKATLDTYLEAGRVEFSKANTTPEIPNWEEEDSD